MSELEEQKKEQDSIEDVGIEFIEYNIDEDAETYHDDVSKLKDDAKKKKEEEAFDLKKEILSWVFMFILAVAIAMFVSTFILFNAEVPTGSMENTIPTESRMIGLRLSYLFSDPERGDIIIFKNPNDETEDYVKRIIGLPGETVVIKDSSITIYDANGNVKIEKLSEPYLKDKVWTAEGETYEFKVPKDRYLVLGDNRNGSADARTWYRKAIAEGTSLENVYIHKDKILAQALFTYWKSFKIFEDVKYE